MLLLFSHHSDEPLHAQIFNGIRGLILRGELAPGDALPSIRVFARSHKVSVITVGRAYDDLARAGLIYSRQGRPSTVAELSPEDRTARVRSRLNEHMEPLLAQALRDGLDRRRILEDMQALLTRLGGRS